MRILQCLSAYFGTCALCGDPGKGGLDICAACCDDLALNRHACVRCALPLSGPTSELLCGRCLRSPPFFDRLVAPYLYESPCDYMVASLKFSEKLYFGRLIGELLAVHIAKKADVSTDIIVPVPLHADRLRERGFNQSERIAHYIARRRGIPIVTTLLSRDRYTSAQTGLGAQQRKKNVRGAFTVKGVVEGKRVAVVDDVVTTASTVNEVAKVLRHAGAADIQVWAFARAAAHGVNLSSSVEQCLQTGSDRGSDG